MGCRVRILGISQSQQKSLPLLNNHKNVLPPFSYNQLPHFSTRYKVSTPLNLIGNTDFGFQSQKSLHTYFKNLKIPDLCFKTKINKSTCPPFSGTKRSNSPLFQNQCLAPSSKAYPDYPVNFATFMFFKSKSLCWKSKCWICTFQ